MSVQQVLDWHAAHGYTAVAVTDHNTFKGGIEAAELARASPGGIVALVGMEWSHCRGHYNFIIPYDAARSLSWDGSRWVSNRTNRSATSGGVANASTRRLRASQLRGARAQPAVTLHASEEAIAAEEIVGELAIPLAKYPTDDEIKQAFAAVHALGGIAVANHLPWSAWNLEPEQLPSREAIVDWKADYVELAHEMYLDAQSLPYVQSGELGAIAGGDVHFPTQHSYGWTCLHAANPTDEASIFDALRKPSDVDLIFDAVGTPDAMQEGVLDQDQVATWPTIAKFFAPLRWVGEYFQSFYYAASSTGRPTYAYSFVEGFCGAPQVYKVRWEAAAFGLVWLLILFGAYHALLAAWARCRGEGAAAAL